MLGPIIRGQRVHLVPPQREHLPLWQRWFNDPDVVRYLHFRFPPSPDEQERIYTSWADDDAVVRWLIVAGDEPVGQAGLRSIDWMNRHAVSNLMIGERDAWNKGYATEAVALRTEYAFKDLGLERLESSSVTENVGMHRALERNGYRRIGVIHHCLFRNGRWYDEAVFELLRDEWERHV